MSQGALCTPKDAADAFKDTVNDLMKGLQPIILRYDPKGWAMPDARTLLASASSGGGLTKIFENGLTPTVKFLFVQAWAKNMSSVPVMEQFIKNTKSQWELIESSTEKEQEKALLSIITGLDIPGKSGDGKPTDFLLSLYQKKDLLSSRERNAILEYFKTCCYYGESYEYLKRKELMNRK